MQKLLFPFCYWEMSNLALSFSPQKKLNPYSASTEIPTPPSFLSKSDFSPGPVHRMFPLPSRKRKRRGQKACYHGERKEKKMVELWERNEEKWIRKKNKPRSSSSFPYPSLVSILISSPFPPFLNAPPPLNHSHSSM